MKLTRSEKAAVSAVKVANAMYKAAKAPTQDEFLWDERDYLSPEEMFWIDLDAILAEVKAPAELKAEVYEYAKEVVYDFSQFTADEVAQRFLGRTFMPSWVENLEVYVSTFLPLVAYSEGLLADYGMRTHIAKEIVQAFEQEAPTEATLDSYIQSFSYFVKKGVTSGENFWCFARTWEDTGFSLELDKYQVASGSLKWWVEDRPEVHAVVYGHDNPYTNYVGDTASVLEAIEGFRIDTYGLMEMTEDLTEEEAKQYALEGKFRMLKKHSTLPRDVFEAYGLPGYVCEPSGYYNDEICLNAARLGAELLKKGFKLNVKALRAALGTTGRIQQDQWYDVLGFILLGSSGVGLDKSLHLEDITNYRIIPENMKKLVAQSDQAIYWCFFTDLEIDWTVSKNSAKNCIISAIACKYALYEHEAISMFENPGSKAVLEFLEEHAHKPNTDEHNMPVTETITVDGYTVSLLPKTDFRNLYIGELTGCCQKLGGAGEDVCIEGWYDQYSSNYVLATSSGKILAHFWLWQTTEGGYVIDSVEARSSMDVDILTDLVVEWVDVALGKAHIFISDCGYGITQQVVKKLREEFTLTKEDEPKAAFDPVSHYSYRDSRNGVFFIE